MRGMANCGTDGYGPASDLPRLRRVLGPLDVTASGVGIIIGAGIYVLLGAATAEAGNAVWVSVIVAAGLCALTGLSYAELASMFPNAGAEYVNTRIVKANTEAGRGLFIDALLAPLAARHITVPLREHDLLAELDHHPKSPIDGVACFGPRRRRTQRR